MKRFFVNFNLDVGNSYVVEGIEHNHIKNVLRMSIGDRLILVCGDEYDYVAEIENMSKGYTKVVVLEKRASLLKS